MPHILISIDRNKGAKRIMNHKMLRYMLGKMMGVEALLLLFPAFVGLIYKEKEALSFVLVSFILLVIFLIFGLKKPENTTIYGKEGFFIAGMSWILWAIFGAIPFTITGCIPFYLDAVFETISGFTTTGSTILNDIEVLPNCMNFWRCLTHWVGGMGVLVFVMMVTSLGEKNSMHLMRAEMPGPEASKLVPKAKSTARILYIMYLVLTVVEVIFLLFGGMNLFDAIIHSFSTAGTGGFSNRNASIAYYDSAYIDAVITIFMVLFGVNFNLYYFAIMGNIKELFKNEELRVYIGIIASSVVLISINILGQYGTITKAVRYASFQVGAIITTTGFCTANYELWPEFSKCILLLIMVIGACAGSTGGGIKISRLVIMLKSIKREIQKMIHPQSVSIVKLNDKKVSEQTINSVYIYFICYVFILMFSVLIVSFDNKDFATNFSGVLTALSNVGPGISKLAPVENFSSFSPLSKFVFCADMLIGRLEIFPYLLLFSTSFGKKKF